jgi:hypothetical protein
MIETFKNTNYYKFTPEFIPELEQQLGTLKSYILQIIDFEIEQNKSYGKKFFINGLFWMYSSVRNFKESYGLYWSDKQISRALNSLISDGILIQGIFNIKKYDKTSWYTINYNKLFEILNIEPVSISEIVITDDTDKMSNDSNASKIHTPVQSLKPLNHNIEINDTQGTLEKNKIKKLDKMSEPIPVVVNSYINNNINLKDKLQQHNKQDNSSISTDKMSQKLTYRKVKEKLEEKLNDIAKSCSTVENNKVQIDDINLKALIKAKTTEAILNFVNDFKVFVQSYKYSIKNLAM